MPKTSPPRGLDKQAAKYMDALTASNRFSGTVLLAQRGRTLFSGAYGLANAELGVANTLDTRFRIYSISKSFSGVAVMIMQDRGQVDINLPIATYLPECPAAWGQVTLRHTLNHTSGLPNYFTLPDWEQRAKVPASVPELIALVRDRPMEFTTGSRYSYNNSGYLIAGYIIELVAGTSFENFVRDNIMLPLGMNDSGCDRFDTLITKRACGYKWQDGVLKNADFVDMANLHAAGGIYSTAPDMRHWDTALGTEKLLSTRSLEAMTTIVPFIQSYGLGLQVYKHFGRRVVGHGGGYHGFRSRFLRFPAEELSVVVLSNLENADVGTVAHDLVAMALGETWEMPKPRPTATLKAEQLDVFAGRYQWGPHAFLTIERLDQRLRATPGGQTAIILQAATADTFFRDGGDEQVSFTRDRRGKVTGLTLRQSETDFAMAKID